MPRIVEVQVEEGRGGEGGRHVQSNSVTGARCCSCSTFLSSAEKTHSDPDNLKNYVQVPNIALACFVTVCLVLDCQNWVSFPLKIYSKTSH